MATDPARWIPDAFTLARGEALQGRIPYAPGSEIAVAGEPTQRPIPPAVEVFAEWIARWPGVTSAGKRRSPPKPSTAGRRRDLHEEGRAVDAMLADEGSPAANATADALASLLVRNADRLGVQGVIARRAEWYASPYGAAWEAYDGPDPHVSHVHIELSPEAARWSADEMRQRIAAVVRAPAAPGGASLAPVAIVAVAAVVAGVIVWRARRRRP